ncbi:MAG: Mur ligase domain-containing protein [Evtepia gabavorous]
MEPMTVRELLTATGGRLLGEEAVAERTITGVETDSRAVHEGDLFVALRGERTDGHRYIASALETGAAGCLTEEVPKCCCLESSISRWRTPCWPLARWPGRIERSFPSPSSASLAA